MRVLLSAYACEPNRGSEPGVGWNWAVEIARMGHEVWVITRANNQGVIEAALRKHPVENLHFVYYDLPAWTRRWKKQALQAYYRIWQLGAYRVAKRLVAEVPFDRVHHLTFVMFRAPSFMAFLGIPFIFGPVGGGEHAPKLLRKSFHLQGKLLDATRDFANWLARFDPVLHGIYQRSSLILCTTRETMAQVPAQYWPKCRVTRAIGIDAQAESARHVRMDGEFRILYVGNLLYLKGIHLGLRAFAQLREGRPNVKLTLIGSGPDAAWLKGLSDRLDVGDRVEWIPHMPQTELMKRYADYDAFLFPSLRDSGGCVVMEAMAQGLPVVCLDLGGPRDIVDASSGLIVKTLGLGEQEVIRALAEALDELAGDASLRSRLGDGALRRSREFAWSRIVREVYAGECVEVRGR